MRTVLAILLCSLLPSLALSQTAPASLPGGSAAPAPQPKEKELKRPSGTWPTPPAVMFRESQRTAYAIQLQDYCNDITISDDFLRQQFAKLSRITGHEENCETVRTKAPGFSVSR